MTDGSGTTSGTSTLSSGGVAVPEAAMQEALRLARAAGRLGNVPVGAVVVHEERIVGRSGNLRDTLQDPTAHAEVLALREAAQALGTWRLEGCTLYVTLEPCAMCAGAVGQARLSAVVYATAEPRTGAVASTARLLDGTGVTTRSLEGSDADLESARTLREFFADVRGQSRPAGRKPTHGEMAELVEGA